MQFEFSAGGVVFRKERDEISLLLAQHAKHHGWVFPKGLIGDKKDGELKEEAAVREVEEETGVKAMILQALTPEVYWYMFHGEKRKKTVYYFIMRYVSGDITKHDLEMESVEWLPLGGVSDRLTYQSDKDVWHEARQIIEKL